MNLSEEVYYRLLFNGAIATLIPTNQKRLRSARTVFNWNKTQTLFPISVSVYIENFHEFQDYNMPKFVKLPRAIVLYRTKTEGDMLVACLRSMSNTKRSSLTKFQWEEIRNGEQ